jgi:hypothetical protein
MRGRRPLESLYGDDAARRVADPGTTIAVELTHYGRAVSRRFDC